MKTGETNGACRKSDTETGIVPDSVLARSWRHRHGGVLHRKKPRMGGSASGFCDHARPEPARRGTTAQPVHIRSRIARPATVCRTFGGFLHVHYVLAT